MLGSAKQTAGYEPELAEHLQESKRWKGGQNDIHKAGKQMAEWTESIHQLRWGHAQEQAVCAGGAAVLSQLSCKHLEMRSALKCNSCVLLFSLFLEH